MTFESASATASTASRHESAGSWGGPVFIVGMPRSGTKLLRGLLSQHPCVRISHGETEFLPFLADWVERHGPPQTEQAFAELYAAMRGATYFHYRPAESGPFDSRRWRAACAGRHDAGGLFEGFMRYELGIERGSRVLWADKSPAYIRHMPLLLEQFPSARIVHLARDVRDYCVSVRKAWNKDIRRAAWMWGRDVLRAHEHCKAASGRCIEVRYEDLLRDPAGQMRRLCLFLDLEFLPAVTKLASNVENRGDATGRAEIVRNNAGKFAGRLTAAEIADIESLAWGSMQALGYEPLYADRPRALGPLALRWLRLKDGVRLIAGDAARFGLIGSVRFHRSHSRMTRRSAQPM